MNDDRMRILKMLEAGKISVEDAAQLIKALEEEPAADRVQTPVVPATPPELMPSNYASPDAAPCSTSPLSFGRAFLGAIASSLDGIITDGAQTEGSRIFAASLDKTNLTDSNLEGCWIAASSVSKANFEGANLRGARIIGSDLGNSDFRGANLEGALILFSSLENGDFRGVDLSGKSIICTSLPGVHARSKVVDWVVKE